MTSTVIKVPGRGERFLQELKSEFRLKNFGLSHANPSLFVNGQCFHSRGYLLWSGFWALFVTSMQMLGVYYNKDKGARYLIYLTNITYILQNITSIMDFTVALYVYLTRRGLDDDKGMKMTWYFKVLWVLFTTTNTASIVVTGMYFGVLKPVFTHDSINKHLINGLYSVLNILMCAKPVRVLHAYQPMTMAFMYVLFTLFYHLAGGGTIYNPLDWSNVGRSVSVAVLVVFVACPLIHVFLFYSLYTVRIFVFHRCCSGAPRVDSEPEVISRNFTIGFVEKSVERNEKESVEEGGDLDDEMENEFYLSKSAHDETMLQY